MWLRKWLVFLSLLPAAASAGVKEKIAAMAPAGVVLVQDADGRDLLAQNAERPFTPASVAKIVTAWLALKVLGPDYRFKTRFYLDAGRVLYVRGGGDPYLISEELAALARELAAKIGKAPLSGLVVDGGYYPADLAVPGIEDDDKAYDAADTALAANFNTIFAIRKGDAVLAGEPQTPITPLAEAEFRARAPQGPSRIALRDPVKSETYAGELIAAFLAREGVALNGPVTSGAVPAELAPVYVHEQSRPLSEIIALLMRASNNYTANQIFLEIGGAKYGGPVSLEKSLRVADSALAAEGLGSALRIEEGSGISRNDRFTAHGLAKVLALFAPYADLLHGHDKGLDKTGTMDGVRTLAGYADTHKHGRVRFVIALTANDETRFRVLREIEAGL